MATLASLSIDLVANSASLVNEVKKANKAIDGFAVGTRRAATAAKVFFVAAGGNKLVDLSRNAINTADQMGKLADRLGSTSEALSELGYAAELSGVSFNTLSMGLQRMTRRVAEAANGTGEAKNALHELNLSAFQLSQLAPEDQFALIAEKISLLSSESDKVRLAMKLFDSEGVSLIQTMGEGAKGIANLREEARKMGATISGETAIQAAEFNDALTRMSTKLDSIVRLITVEFMGAIDGMSTAFQDFVGSEATLEGVEKRIDTITSQMLRLEKGFVLNFQPGQMEELREELVRLLELQEELMGVSDPVTILITGGKEQIEEDLEYTKSALEELLMTKKDILLQDIAAIEEKIANEVILEEDGLKQIQRLREKYAKQELKARFKHETDSYNFQRMSASKKLGVFANFFSAAAQLDDGFVKASRVTGAASALISTYQGAAKALTLPFPANLAAAAAVLSSGFGFISAIKGSGGGGGGGPGVVPPAPLEATTGGNDIIPDDEPKSKTVIINIEGIDDEVFLNKRQVRSIVDQINDERDANVKVIL